MTARNLELTIVPTSLIEKWQRGFPLAVRPFTVLGRSVGLSEKETISSLRGLIETGVISRVGATLRPNTAGASLLAAMRVPPARLDEVAAIVNREPGVNHNYEREHAFNLWFVVTGRDRQDLNCALDRIRDASCLDVLELPLERGYHIDLGFPLGGQEHPRRIRPAAPCCVATAIDDTDRAILAAIEHGLPLVSRPFAEVARGIHGSEAGVIERLKRLCDSGVVTRLGLIVRHRTLGISANAMAVWDVPDAEVDRIGQLLAEKPCVTLCYRRPRRLPDWRYNLFCMVHGRERASVRSEIIELTRVAALRDVPADVLFSGRCYRQRGPTVKTSRGGRADA